MCRFTRISDRSLSRNCGIRGPLDRRPGSLLSLRNPTADEIPVGPRAEDYVGGTWSQL